VRQFLQRLALYAFHVLFARPVLRWLAGVRYRRRSRVPAGPCLVVANHNSHLDAAVLMSMFPLRRLARIHPVAAADYFGSNWFMRTLALLFMNGIPIERRPSRGEDTLGPIVELLRSGKTLIFFPEGSRGEAGVVAKFRAGVGRLVQEVPGLLVVPVFLSGPERIWPRGQLVPVPLSVDAIVGRPRVYPALEDPRDIAELVRHDVLALAPPPPPVPGVRPAPPLRVAVCGIDGTGAHDVFRQVTERLGMLGATLGVSDAVLEADAAGLREATGPVPARPRAGLRLLAAITRTGPRFKGRRFAQLIERSRLNEALSQGHETRFVVEDGCVIVDLLAVALADQDPPVGERELRDLLAYLTGEMKAPVARAWRLAWNAPALGLVSALDLTRPPVPEVLLLLTLPPGRAMQRLRSTGVELLPYQNEAGLARLQDAYRQVGDLLRRRRRVELLELDASDLDGAEAARQVETLCRSHAALAKVSPGS
jgi:1-acyl-sn-glycerol-3-phosphate acyltransferase